jgi:SAM-dependent methyltransferase
MSDGANWSHGYVTDVLYTDNTYRELSPAWLNYVAAQKACLPRPLDQPFTYVELGCGLGRSVTHFAAAFPRGHFIGVDFNPAHIDAAQRYAAMLGVENVRFIERGFEDLVGEANARQLGLPDIDFIVLHGVYSWIPPEARRAVQRFIYERLKPGGLVYNSYNCQPGWTPEAPLRQLLVELAAAQSGATEGRIGHALDQLEAFGKFDLGFLNRQPAAKQAIEQYRKRPVNYLAHEMLNADWSLFYSSDVADEMAAAKLDYVGAATLLENHPDLLLPDDAAAFVSRQPNQRLRQLVQDFLVNQRFRRDVFVRGHAHLSPGQMRQQCEGQIAFAMKPVAKIGPKIKVPRGVVGLEQKLLQDLGGVLAKGTATLHALELALNKGRRSDDLLRVFGILFAAGVLAPAANLLRVDTGFDGSGKLRLVGKVNQPLLEMAASREGAEGKARILVSPVLGGILPISLVSAVILQGFMEGGGLERVLDRSTAVLDKNGLTLRKGEENVTEPAAKRAYLKQLAQGFLDQEMPLLLTGGVVEAA